MAGRGYSEQQSMFWRIKVELHILRCISTLGQMRIYSISSSTSVPHFSSTNVIGFSEAVVGFAGRCSGTSGKQEKGSPTLTQGAAWLCVRLLAGDSRHAITEGRPNVGYSSCVISVVEYAILLLLLPAGLRVHARIHLKGRTNTHHHNLFHSDQISINAVRSTVARSAATPDGRRRIYGTPRCTLQVDGSIVVPLCRAVICTPCE